MSRRHPILTRRHTVVLASAALIVIGASGYFYRMAAARAALAKTYRVTEIAPLPGFRDSHGFAINASGEVTGRALADPAPSLPLIVHGFLWKNGQAADLGVMPGMACSNGFALNNRGQVVGRLEIPAPTPKVVPKGYYPPDPRQYAFQADAGKMMRLPLPPGCTDSVADGINDHGQIAETAFPPNSSYGHAFLDSKGQLTDLGRLGTLGRHSPTDSEAHGINSSGQVVGTSTLSISFDIIFHAFRYDRGRMQDLGSLPGFRDSAGTAINDRGQVTGFAAKMGPSYNYGGFRRAFLWQEGKMTDLGTPPGFRESIGTALNSRGDVVGYAASFPLLQQLFRSELPFGNSSLEPPHHAFLYHAGQMDDLNALIPADSGWVLEAANGINDKGQIVGTGWHNGKVRAFVLTPLIR